VPSGYPALSASNIFRIAAGEHITFRTAAGVLVGTAKVTTTVDVTSAAAVTVAVEPLTFALALTDVAYMYRYFVLTGLNMVDRQGQDTSEDTTKLKSGQQSQDAVTSRKVSLSVTTFSNRADKGLWQALYPYGTRELKDLLVGLYAQPGQLAIVGMGNVTNLTLPLNPTAKIKITATINMVAPYTEFPIRSEVQPASLLAQHDVWAEYLGFAPLTQFA
jgi:hypothetical protein